MANTAATLLHSSQVAQPKFLPLPLPAFHCCPFHSLQRGSLLEVHGNRSTGRSSFGNYALAQATGRGEICAVIDLFDSFAPVCAEQAGVELDRLVWVRCSGNAEFALRATDLLLHAGGFGVALLDLCEAAPRVMNRIPLSYWYRFRRAVENTPTILLITSDRPQAKASSNVGLKKSRFHWSGNSAFKLLRGVETQGVLTNSGVVSMPAGIQAVA